MKKNLWHLCILMILALACVCCIAAAEGTWVQIDEIHFPDEAFRSVVAGYDLDGDGLLSGEEAAKAVEVDVSEKYVKTLQGIEYLTGLEKLDCSENPLTQLDVSRNTKLTELACSEDLLTELDVSRNPELAFLYCSGNELTELDLRENPGLIRLVCTANRLTQLDVSGNTKLTELACGENLLKELDVSRHAELAYLYCEGNRLTELNLRGNPELTHLDCSKNLLTQLDLYGNRYVRTLSCSGNQLKMLDISFCTELASTVRRKTPVEEEGILKWKADEVLSVNRANLEIDPAVVLYAGESRKTDSANGINGDILLFYNPEGGKHYHTDQQCLDLDNGPVLKNCFLYAERDREPYCDLLPCERCFVPMTRTGETPYASFGDIEDPMNTSYQTYFNVAVVERDGSLYRVVSGMDDQGRELLSEVIKTSWSGDDDNDEFRRKYREYLSYIESLAVSYEEKITEAPLSPDELNVFAGEPLGEVFGQGFELRTSGFNGVSDAYFYLDKGLFEYVFYVEISGEEYEACAARKDFNDLIVERVNPAGVSERACYLSYGTDGTRIETD